MSQKPTRGIAETRYPISAADRESEKAVLSDLGMHFVNTTGSVRDAYDNMAAATPIAERIILSEIDQHDVRGLWVRPEEAPSDRAILFFHGGAYILGSAKAYSGLASQLAVRTGISTFVLDYPLAPEHPFPAAFDAATASRRWLGGQGYDQVALAGDSAGAGLAFGVMSPADGLPRVAAVVAFSPWTDLAFTGASFNDPATYDPIFPSPEILANAASTYLAGADPKDGRALPMFSIPEIVPPLLIQLGSDERLLDDARHYADAAAARGGKVILEIYEGLHHVLWNLKVRAMRWISPPLS